MVKNWLELTLVREIQVFIGFANFYQRFNQGFSKIAAPLTLLLKAIRLSDLGPKMFKRDDNKVVGVGGRANKMVVNLFKNNKSRNSTYMLIIRAIKKPNFLILNIKKSF